MNSFIHELIKTAQSTASTNRVKRNFFCWRQPRNFENVTVVAHRRKHFRGSWAVFFVAELPQKSRCFNTEEFTRILSTGVG